MLLTISALITPGHHAYLGLGKAHAKFAQAAGVGFGFGLVLNLPAISHLPARRRLPPLAAVTLAVGPITLYLYCRFFFGVAGSVPVVAALQQSSLGSLAFWEWVGSVPVYLFIALIVLTLTPGR